VLAILGLAGVVPRTLMPIATIVVGSVLLAEARVGALCESLVESPAPPLLSYGEDRAGRSAELLAGAIGVVLGIVALVGLIPVTLCSVAMIGFGAAMLLGSLSRRRFASTGGEVVVGSGAVVLGYLALLGFASVPLVLAGALGLGAWLLVSGSALGAHGLHMVRAT
jgi:hypothetical protein